MKNKILLGILVFLSLIGTNYAFYDRDITTSEWSVTEFGIKTIIEDIGGRDCIVRDSSDERSTNIKLICKHKLGSDYHIKIIIRNTLAENIDVGVNIEDYSPGYQCIVNKISGLREVDNYGYREFYLSGSENSWVSLKPGESRQMEIWGDLSDSPIHLRTSDFGFYVDVRTPLNEEGNQNKYYVKSRFELVSCFSNDDCEYDEECSDYRCEKPYCGPCTYMENHECVKYECCSDVDCGSGYGCKNHECEMEAVTTAPTTAPTTVPTTILATQSQGGSTWLMGFVIIILLAIIVILLVKKK